MRRTHGGRNDRLYYVWWGMCRRCINPAATSYRYYGARGISVCDLWRTDYLAFKAWAIENGYRRGLSIDRINTNGNYRPENCRWVSATEQARNTRRNVFLEHNGERLTLVEMAGKYGMKPATLQYRISRGWPVALALETVVGSVRKAPHLNPEAAQC